MIELPEALVRAKELKENLTGKVVQKVYGPSSEHKFCWFYGDVETYEKQLKGKPVLNAKGFGIFVEVEFSDDTRLCFNDGTVSRLIPLEEAPPKKYQLLIVFTDGYSLVFTVSMYGAIVCCQGEYENEYYQKSIQGMLLLSDSFDEAYFKAVLRSVKQNMSVKAFLATEQRFPGLGNGTLQDILFCSKLNPKRKIESLSEEEIQRLHFCIKDVLKDMVKGGGRDTEKNIFGQPGGYQTLLSRNSYAKGCSACGGRIIKEAYLGGTVYYCPGCQPLKAL